MSWLKEAVRISHENLTEEMLGYALGRGLPHSLLREMQVGTWTPLQEDAPDEDFRGKNGPRGEWRKGWMTIPYWTPAGTLSGLEFRTWGEGGKEVRDFRTPSSKWSPCYIGLTPTGLQKIWEGGDVWIVEGVFDLCLAHAVPARDVVLACGTARLSHSQADFLVRFLSPGATVHVAYDMDRTGRNQVEGYTDESSGKRIPGVPERLRKRGLRARAVHYRGGKDPGEIWEAGGKPYLKKMFSLHDLT